MSDDRLVRALAREILRRKLVEIAEERSEQWEQRQRQWIDRMEEKKSRLTGFYKKLLEQVGRIDANLTKLATQYRSATKPDFKSKIKTWVAQDLTRRQQLVTKLNGIRDSIESIKRKLQEGSQPPAYYQGQRNPFAGIMRIEFGLVHPPAAPDIKLIDVKPALRKPVAAKRPRVQRVAVEEAPAKEVAVDAVTAKKAPAKKVAVKAVATKTPAKKVAVKAVAAKKAPAKKVAVKAVATKTPAKKVAVKAVAAKKAPAKKAAVKAAATKVPAKKVAVKAAAAKKAPAKKAAVKAVATKAPAKKVAVKAVAAKKAPAKKAATKVVAAKKR